MRLEIECGCEELTDALRDHIRRRLESALEGHLRELGTVAVRLVDRRGKEPASKRCHISIHVETLRSSVVVGEGAPDVFDAVARAADVAGEAVRRKLAAGLV